MNILPLKDIDTVATYLKKMNSENTNYVEYIPHDLEEIKLKLQQNFSDQNFYYVQDDNQIVAALGFEYVDNETVNVWGPIVNDTSEAVLNEVKVIWTKLLNNHPNVKYCHISLHKEHVLNNSKLKTLHAGYVETRYTLEIHHTPHKVDNQNQMIKYSKPYFYSFDKLHSKNFKNSDLNSVDIVSSLNDDHALYLYIAEGLVKGYIYLSIDTPLQLATIPYLASHKDYRKQGIAFQMIHYATTEAFKHDNVKTVRIHVNNKKHEQIQLLYEKVGFEIVNETHHFKYVRTD
ncbi:GNAT family N-acetyltransferase [Mammaliicoccus stepanovicii]|uniref:GNAT family acetyltransferase n=1 Tax=Mammaliicoccus stepanovicii TaxID=643214 RepID=A0A239YJ00_9STAP|nr:GNAT family N-acetyltransferase [Mammaliicoccus stepanovicii]PNZ76910.1 GNAT family N-acetyltransferase [Mammaliicoccus stepanovicii]GGI40999.1 N-acetyltransferase [Mammaliicoccus stepanovicii]SNV59109.1 GNAT family acetyltransferase [Mammaliicoccus stepanovicii]